MIVTADVMMIMAAAVTAVRVRSAARSDPPFQYPVRPGTWSSDRRRGHGPLMYLTSDRRRGHGPLMYLSSDRRRGHGPLMYLTSDRRRGHGPLMSSDRRMGTRSPDRRMPGTSRFEHPPWRLRCCTSTSPVNGGVPPSARQERGAESGERGPCVLRPVRHAGESTLSGPGRRRQRDAQTSSSLRPRAGLTPNSLSPAPGPGPRTPSLWVRARGQAPLPGSETGSPAQKDDDTSPPPLPPRPLSAASAPTRPSRPQGTGPGRIRPVPGPGGQGRGRSGCLGRQGAGVGTRRGRWAGDREGRPRGGGFGGCSMMCARWRKGGALAVTRICNDSERRGQYDSDRL